MVDYHLSSKTTSTIKWLIIIYPPKQPTPQMVDEKIQAIQMF